MLPRPRLSYACQWKLQIRQAAKKDSCTHAIQSIDCDTRSRLSSRQKITERPVNARFRDARSNFPPLDRDALARDEDDCRAAVWAIFNYTREWGAHERASAVPTTVRLLSYLATRLREKRRLVGRYMRRRISNRRRWRSRRDDDGKKN